MMCFRQRNFLFSFQQLKKVKSKSPTHVSLNENQKMKTKVEELQKELSSKNQKLQVFDSR